MPETTNTIPLPDPAQSWDRRRLLEAAADVLEAGEVSEARRNAEWMLEEVTSCSRVQLYAFGGRAVPSSQVRRLNDMLARRLRHEPVQYIVGYAEFYGLRLGVSPDVLIPRPETEQVVEAALERIGSRTAPRVLDIGTGSGCMALAVKHERPDAAVYACDVSSAALDVARENAALHGLDVSFLHVDVLRPDAYAALPGTLDLLLSNPPYVPEEERSTLPPDVSRYEPARALFSGGDPLRFYRAIVGHAEHLLVPGGWIAFETHGTYADAVADLLRQYGFSSVACAHDLSGVPRIVAARAGT